MSWLREDKLLLLSCRTEIGSEDRNALIGGPRNIDWDCFLKKARQEGVSPLVFSRLPKIIINRDDIPRYVREKLKEDYYLNAARNTLIF